MRSRGDPNLGGFIWGQNSNILKPIQIIYQNEALRITRLCIYLKLKKNAQKVSKTDYLPQITPTTCFGSIKSGLKIVIL